MSDFDSKEEKILFHHIIASGDALRSWIENTPPGTPFGIPITDRAEKNALGLGEVKDSGALETKNG